MPAPTVDRAGASICSIGQALLLGAIVLVCCHGFPGAVGVSRYSTGLRPTSTTTEFGGKLNPNLTRVEGASLLLYSGDQFTPKNAGPNGGPKSKLRNSASAWAAFAA